MSKVTSVRRSYDNHLVTFVPLPDGRVLVTELRDNPARPGSFIFVRAAGYPRKEIVKV